MKRLVIFVWLSLAAVVSAQEVVTLPTRPGVTQAYFLLAAQQKPQAIAVLFPGGGGYIGLQPGVNEIQFDATNFLVRSRDEFAKRGVSVALADAPSDQHLESGMSDLFRLSNQHFTDISAVVADLEKRFSGMPLFLIGTSRGTISAADLAAKLGSRIAGVALTAAVFRQANRRSDKASLIRFDFASIKAPLLFVHHRADRCSVTPYSEVKRYSGRYPLISVSGGSAPQSDECEGLSAHGFFGKESETVAAIVDWMLKRPFRREID